MIQRFMFGLGPVSSLYDFITFGVMLWLFNAGPELFRAVWFIESLATQTLVIFVIRTVGNPFKSRPSRALLLTVIVGVVAGVVVVVSPLGAVLGFAPLPPLFFGVLVLLTVTYLVFVQVLKRRFYGRADGVYELGEVSQVRRAGPACRTWIYGTQTLYQNNFPLSRGRG